MIKASTLNFLNLLKKNNHKDWFDTNREKYDSSKQNFDEFVALLLEKMVSVDADLKDLLPKNCTFRINRDVRFSKDKTPYKISLSASFTKGGKKSVNAGYYFHLQPGGQSFVGGGLWMPPSNELKKLRQEIDYCFHEFKMIVNASPFKKHYGELEKEEKQMLVNVPKGYEKENPAGDFLRMKSYVATKNLSDEEVLSAGLLKETVAAFHALKPLVHFINRAVE